VERELAHSCNCLLAKMSTDVHVFWAIRRSRYVHVAMQAEEVQLTCMYCKKGTDRFQGTGSVYINITIRLQLFERALTTPQVKYHPIETSELLVLFEHIDGSNNAV
jgi:hypothetical protein